MRAPLIRPQPAGDDLIVELRRAVSGDPDRAMRCGLLAIRDHREESAVPLLRAATERHPGHAGVAQVYGLAARNLGDLETACAALSRAHLRAPSNALIAHGLARARLEAGLPAIDDFQRALRLAPMDGSVILGFAAARFAAGDIAGSIEQIATIVRAQPLWIEGHATLARLRRMAGRDDPFASFHAALAAQPQAGALWLALLSTTEQSERFADMPGIVAAARRAAPATAGLDLYEAVAADELGDHVRAGTIFDRLPATDDIVMTVRRMRSLLRRGRAADAISVSRGKTALPGGEALWPYLSIAWRLTDDPQWQWLEGDADQIRVYDLAPALGDIDALAARLRTLHIATHEPLDQSVRTGTQTDGPLLSHIDPKIRQLRTAIETTVADYVARLPAPDPTHPLLSARRRPIRFAGSWSVRLSGGGGHHADHIHSQGWISSALYVALPDSLGRDGPGAETGGDGWLTLGASRALLPDLAPFRRIEPQKGRLVLFPSTMWHGTNRFASGERLTVAFDVARLN